MMQKQGYKAKVKVTFEGKMAQKKLPTKNFSKILNLDFIGFERGVSRKNLRFSPIKSASLCL